MNTNEIMNFCNGEFGQMRSLLIDDEPWFVGKDVAQLLGYRNHRDAFKKHIDDEDKADVAIHDGSQNRKMVVINESGLYSLILSSKLPGAKRFKHWVTSDVLPTIRRHGLYAIDEVLADPDTLISALTALKAERAKNLVLKEKVADQKKQLTEMKPKASYCDIVLKCKDVVSISKIAKDYGKSAVWMNCWLHDHGIQYRQGEVWLLYQKYAGKGYTKSQTLTFHGKNGEGRCAVHTYWTQRGRLFIYEQLKEHGILPLIEQRYDKA